VDIGADSQRADPRSARVVLSDLRRAAHELDIAVLCNLHQVGYAREFADRIVGICSGRVVFDGRPDDLDREVLSRIYPGLDPDHIDEAIAEQSIVQPAAVSALEPS
jgi:phosphonate transport system ATP-binding protein